MTKMRWLALVGVITCLGALAPAIIPSASGVAKANFDCIQEGMSQAEVEAIFGAKPTPSSLLWLGCGGIHIQTWQAFDGSEADIHFRFDLVTCKVWTSSTESIAERTRRWIFRIPSPPPQARLGTQKNLHLRNGTTIVR